MDDKFGDLIGENVKVFLKSGYSRIGILKNVLDKGIILNDPDRFIAWDEIAEIKELGDNRNG